MATRDYSQDSPFSQREGSYLRRDQSNGVYNWKPSNTKRFRAALGKAIAGNGLCYIECAGESTTSGQGANGANSVSESAYPAYMRRALGSLGVPLAGNGATRPNLGNSVITPSNMSFTGTWVKAGAGAYAQSNVIGSTITYTGSGTVMEIIYSDASPGGAFSYAIDGGAAVPVSLTNSQGFIKITVTGLSAGSHTVVLTCTAAVNIFIYSFEFRETTGVSITNSGSSGSKIAQWKASPFYNNGGFVVYKAAHLVIFGVFINDLASFTTPDSFEADLRSTVASLLAVSDVVLTTSNAAAGGWTADQWVAFRTIFFKIADEFDIPVFDVESTFPTYTEANSLGLMTDAYHPNANYYSIIGRGRANAVLS